VKSGAPCLWDVRPDVSPLHVLSTIVIERAFDLAMAAILLLTTLPLALGMAWARPVAIITLVVVISGLIALYLVARNNERCWRGSTVGPALGICSKSRSFRALARC
jgi:hypothetical protein